MLAEAMHGAGGCEGGAEWAEILCEIPVPSIFSVNLKLVQEDNNKKKFPFKFSCDHDGVGGGSRGRKRKGGRGKRDAGWGRAQWRLRGGGKENLSLRKAC